MAEQRYQSVKHKRLVTFGMAAEAMRMPLARLEMR
jgi:hypothetical protein